MKFNTCLTNMAKLVADTSVLAIKKIWYPSDRQNLSGYGHYSV